MSDDTIIRIEGLWKRYGLPLPAFVRQGHRWLRSLRDSQNPKSQTPNPKSEIRNSKSSDGPWALRDIDLEVKRGETLGIIGRNGAGKSTLLKVLAGVTPPTRGKVEVSGRVFPMIELNAGLHMELSGLENVRLLGSIMGLSRRKIEVKLPEIAGFCELGDWFDRPVRKYSSGMLARLGFAVAMNIEADVLLIDEVLAVGDAAFQRKCVKSFERLRTSGCTIIFVSHAIRQVERVCGRAVLLDEGRMITIGPSSETAIAYYEQIQRRLEQEERASQSMSAVLRYAEQHGRPVRLTSVTFWDTEGRQITTMDTGDSLEIRLTYEAEEEIPEPRIGLSFITTDNLVLVAFKNEACNAGTQLGRQGTIRCRIPRLPLIQGTYYLSCKLLDRMGIMVGGLSEAAYLSVTTRGDDRFRGGGFLVLDSEWILESGSSIRS